MICRFKSYPTCSSAWVFWRFLWDVDDLNVLFPEIISIFWGITLLEIFLIYAACLVLQYCVPTCCWWSLPVGLDSYLTLPWLKMFSYFIFIWINLNLLFQRNFFSWLKADSLIKTLMSVSSLTYRHKDWKSGQIKGKCLIFFFLDFFF